MSGKLVKIKVTDYNIPEEFKRYDVAFSLGNNMYCLTNGSGGSWCVGGSQIQVLDEESESGAAKSLRALLGQDVSTLSVQFR